MTIQEHTEIMKTSNPNKSNSNDNKDTTVEWILWKHSCQRQGNQTGDEWKEGIKEGSHFFAHAPHEQFRMDLHHLPIPSKTFFLKTTKNSLGEHQAEQRHTEYSLFQGGVRPEWEDPQCAGELYARHFFPPELLDRYWQELAHGIMEGKIDNHYICGIRVVDKSKGKHPMYKLEVWLNTDSSSVRGMIRKQALACIKQDDHYRFNFHWRAFDNNNVNDNDNDNEDHDVSKHVSDDEAITQPNSSAESSERST